ncbi:MAG TPA: DUF885 domain-containing protein [Gemmatimonadota bacterium]|nr:DUF885 domain-containing protein [Gemmatimonadota bacterium]
MRRRALPVATLVLALACADNGPAPPPESASVTADPVARSLALAEGYVEAYYEQFPEEAYEAGYPDAPGDRLSDRSPAAIAAWHAREDSLLRALEAIDSTALAGTEAAIPHAYALDRLRASVARRVCRTDLWNVSPTWTGWPELFPSVFAQQPVDTPDARAAALARARDVDRFLDTEIANLREGIRLGYTAARPDVDAVISQVDAFLELPVEESPFLEPVDRTGDAAFADSLRGIVVDEIVPAARRYRDVLADEYRSAAREEVGVTANPDGAACYEASVRFFTTLPLTAEEIHASGLREMDRIQAEMKEIAERLFGTDDLKEALRRAREPRFTFRSEDEILAYARAAVERGRAAVPEWFGTVPEADVVVRPYPAFQKRTGGGFYSSGLPGQPGIYLLGTYEPEKLSKAGLEATAFHETYPGHHMQGSVVLEKGGAHPVLKYFFNSGMGEGWALYTERLADEMGLYSGDIDRLGMLSNEALRAARLVVDPGMHALGWTRERAVEYMLENTAESEGEVGYEIDRYLAVPGQATAYLTGSLEIQRLRAEAEARLGERFDVRAFHDRVLQNGTISLPMLRAEIDRWVVERGGTATVP